MKRLAFGLLFLLFLWNVVGAYEETKELYLSAKGIESLEIEAGAGYLKIQGIPGLENIEVKARIEVKGISAGKARRFIEKEVKLGLKRHNKKARLISKIERGFSFFSFNRSAVVNLTVRVPQPLSLEIDDGSGSLQIEDIVGDLDIVDGSGSITIQHIEGDVRIEDGSGSLKVWGVTGQLDIEDGSGSIDVKQIEGDLSVEDGSGSMTIRDIGGGVVVKDGSGSISIRHVGNDVVIKEDGSGSVNIQDVKGYVRKPRR